MEESIRQTVKLYRFQLANGMSRDDAFHGIVRFAARNKLDRYSLWQQVIAPEGQ